MNRFAALDGLRGISALAVALYHLPIAIHFYPSPLLREAYVFVDFFFVLSGFVVAHAYADRLQSGEQVGEFIMRRIGRLWPLHASVLAVFLAIECGRLVLAGNLADAGVRPPFSGETSLSLLLANLFLVHAWGLSDLNWNIPSWSISAELFAYFVFAAIIFLARRHAIAAVAGIFVVAWSAWAVLARDYELYSQVLSVRATAGFFAGVLVYAAYRNRGQAKWSPQVGTLMEGLAVGAVLAYLGFVSRQELTPWATPVFALAIFVFASERGLLSSLLKSRPLQILGMLSYSIYLVHPLLITFFNAGAKALGRVFDGDFQMPASAVFAEAAAWTRDTNVVHFGNFWVNDLYALAFVAMVIAVSAVTYRLIELPGQRWFAKLGRPVLSPQAS